MLRLINRYAEIARPIIREYFNADSCIASTRITLEVFKRLGIKGQAVPVQATIGNDKWTVSITADAKGQAVGHVVAWLDKQWLVDASIDQAERPAHDLWLPPVFFCRADRLGRGESVGGVLDYRGHVRLLYEPRLKWLGYQTSNNWRLPSDWMPAVQKILRIGGLDKLKVKG